MARRRSRATGERGGWPTLIGELLPEALDRTGVRNVWTEARLRRAWRQAVGDDVAARTRVGRLRDGVLEVEASDEAWATQLRYLGASVCERLNVVLGAGTVREIAVRRARRRPPSQNPRDDTPTWYT